MKQVKLAKRVNCKKIRRIYGRIPGNQLPVPVPFFLREPVENISHCRTGLGFREKRSCETQLVMMVEDLARNANVGKQTDIILLDFSKAFDKVNHSKLLWKLHQYGIRGQVLGWIRAFLGSRSQRVVLDGEESESIPVTSGVPQGSVLGPILFLIYINDLPDGIFSKVRLFADDTALYLTIEGKDDGAALQQDLDRLSVWESMWDMEFNTSKCQVVQVTGSRRPMNTSNMLHGQVLEAVTSAKYLGVDISSTLSWNSHIHRVVGNANRSLGFIRRNIKTKMSKVLETAYNTLVRPQLEYASAVWDPHTKERITQIEKVQRRAARWTVNNFDQQASVTKIIQELGWRTLEQMPASVYSIKLSMDLWQSLSPTISNIITGSRGTIIL